MLSEGREIIDPDEAEALGLTADARHMRGDAVYDEDDYDESPGHKH